jgi:hypothetical protein
MADTIEELQAKLKLFEQNGAAKMYYALNRKLNEIADMLNANSLKNVSIDDTKDKTFDRIFKLLEKSEVISNAAKSLGEIAGVTNNEEKDINKKPFVDTIAVSR